MTTVLLFHHVLGLTDGVVAFADRLRSDGHEVFTPDLFDGRVFGSIEEGVAHVEALGFSTVIEQATSVANDAALGLGDHYVAAGFSLGAMPAERLALTDDRVIGAVLYHSAAPPQVFGHDGWPESVALQMHIVEDDPWAEEDLPAARTLADTGAGDLLLYPGSGHLVADSSSVDHDPEVAELIVERTLAFLATLGKTAGPGAQS